MRKSSAYLGIIIVFVAGLFLIPTLAQSYGNNKVPILIERTASSNTYVNTGSSYTVEMYSVPINMQNERGVYYAFNDTVALNYDSVNISISWFDKSINISPSFVSSGITKTTSDLSAMGATYKINIYNSTANLDYGYVLESVPTAPNADIDNFYFRYYFSGIDDSDVTISGDTVLLPDNLILRFDDLVANGFTVQSLVKSGTTVILTIGNTSEKSTLDLDPTISLQTAGTQNLEDCAVHEAVPDTVDDGDSLSFGEHLPEDNPSMTYNKWDLGLIPDGSTIDSAELQYFVWLNDYDTGETGEAYTWGIENKTWREDMTTWRTQPNASVTPLVNTTSYDGDDDDFWFRSDITTWVSSEFASGYENMSVLVNATLGYSTMDRFITFSKDYTLNASRTPKLTITYTPKIYVIRPEINQIFSESETIVYFNISNSTRVATCQADVDGANITMTMDAAENRFWNHTNHTIRDGLHTVKFYCNDAITGQWYESVSIDFEVDPSTVTVCRDLKNATRTYTLQNDITTTSDCFVFTNDDITFNCNDYSITGDGGDEGFYSDTIDNVNLQNCTINNFNFGFTFNLGTGYKIENIISNSNNYNRFQVIDDSTCNNISTYGTTSRAIEIMSGAENLNISNFRADSSSSYGIYLLSNSLSSYVNISDSIIESTIPITGVSTSGRLLMINSTYGTEGPVSNLVITRKWYFEPTVKNITGDLVPNVNVSSLNVSEELTSWNITMHDGDIERQELIEYISDGGSKAYQTNYTFYANESTCTYNITHINLTGNFNTILNLSADKTGPHGNNHTRNNTAPIAGEDIMINITINDTCADVASVWIEYNGVRNYTAEWKNNTGSWWIELNNGNLTMGEINGYVIWFNDSYNNLNNTQNYTFTPGNIHPVAQVLDPPYNNHTSNQTQFVRYVCNDTDDTALMVDLIINGSLYGFNHTVVNGTNQSITPNATIAEGGTGLQIRCTDSKDISYSSTVYISTDISNPTSSTNLTSNNTWFGSAQQLHLTETDNLSPDPTTMYCIGADAMCTPSTNINDYDNTTIVSTNGGKYFCFNSTDNASNSKEWCDILGIDMINPEITTIRISTACIEINGVQSYLWYQADTLSTINYSWCNFTHPSGFVYNVISGYTENETAACSRVVNETGTWDIDIYVEDDAGNGLYAYGSFDVKEGGGCGSIGPSPSGGGGGGGPVDVTPLFNITPAPKLVETPAILFEIWFFTPLVGIFSPFILLLFGLVVYYAYMNYRRYGSVPRIPRNNKLYILAFIALIFSITIVTAGSGTFEAVGASINDAIASFIRSLGG